MTEAELHQRRAELWHVSGNPTRTLDDARNFLDSAGFCLMYPVRSLRGVPSFFAAYAGSPDNLPDAKHAFADPRNQPATELMVRLLRERHAYEINLFPESSLLVSAEMFPFFYALLGDRKPKAAPRANARGARLSPLTLRVFDAIDKHGPVSNPKLQQLISRELSAAALDRALNELWSILKITRVDYDQKQGAYWDLLYRWSPQAVMQGSMTSLPESVSTLLGKYLESAIAASQDDIEQFFSYLVARSRVREAIHALLAARELSLVIVGTKTLIHLPSSTDPRATNRESRPRRRIHG